MQLAFETERITALTHKTHNSPDTLLVHSGRHPREFGGVVNTPVVRASTVLYPTLEAYQASRGQKFGALRYGRYGTQTAFALMEALTELDGGHGTVLYPSGLAAIAGVLCALLRPGDHLLMVDSVYGPTRKFCDEQLLRRGVETTYFDPSTGARLADLIRSETRVVYCESPGSLTFEVQDLPAIAAICRPRLIALVVDNTWATPYFFKPLAHGADISIQAATKYVVGHSDAMLGVAVANEQYLDVVREQAAAYGMLAPPDDCWLALRGLRTLGVRLRAHQQNALEVAEWLARHRLVANVMYPALHNSPSHSLWRRDFQGASGLFGVELSDLDSSAVALFVNSLSLFGIGSSWGGYESLVLPSKPVRTGSPSHANGSLVRFHIGLEDPQDLIADLAQAFERVLASRTVHTRRSRHERD
jgi:cysteine-S-conjugate beta-lyase